MPSDEHRIILGPPQPRYSGAEIEKLWPPAAAELSGFAAHLRKRGADITANQLDMAVELASQRAELLVALEESVRMQSHYAALLNEYDGGGRIGFASAADWLARLAEMKRGRGA